MVVVVAVGAGGANNSGRYVGLHGTVMARMAAAILSYDDHDDDHDCIDDYDEDRHDH